MTNFWTKFENEGTIRRKTRFTGTDPTATKLPTRYPTKSARDRNY